jgi:C4-dicarboxylate-specific signal transduction histidine kinase
LLLDELVLNAINAVAGRTDPVIAITGTVQRRFLRRSQLILTISDNGGGMSPDLLAKAKQPFFSTKAGGHVGLGLTNCVELMKTMAGSLDISSTPGKGTSVRIYYSI